MIRKLYIKNFKGYKEFEIDFSQDRGYFKPKSFAIIYGENGIGKSSIIDAFIFLRNSILSLSITDNLNKRMIDGTLDLTSTHDIVKQIKNFRIEALVDGCKRIGSNNKQMILSYEFAINRLIYSYSMCFNDTQIVNESLTVNEDMIFIATKNEIKCNERHFHDRNFVNKIQQYVNDYYGSHSVLSILHFLLFDSPRNNLSAFFSKLFSAFLIEINNISIYRSHYDPIAINFDHSRNHLLENVVSGKIKERDIQTLRNTERVLSIFFSSLYMNIESVEYKTTASENGVIEYELLFKQNNGEGDVYIPFSKESTGTKKLTPLILSLFSVLQTKSIVLIDEIDNGIHDKLLEYIVTNVVKKIKGQLILTSHSLSFLKFDFKQNIYLLDRNKKDMSVHVKCLNEFGRKIQSGTNVLGQYYHGRYGGTYIPKTIDDSWIQEMLDIIK